MSGRTREQIAADLLACARSWEPNVRLLGNVRADEIAALCESIIAAERSAPSASNMQTSGGTNPDPLLGEKEASSYDLRLKAQQSEQENVFVSHAPVRGPEEAGISFPRPGGGARATIPGNRSSDAPFTRAQVAAVFDPANDDKTCKQLREELRSNEAPAVETPRNTFNVALEMFALLPDRLLSQIPKGMKNDLVRDWSRMMLPEQRTDHANSEVVVKVAKWAISISNSRRGGAGGQTVTEWTCPLCKESATHADTAVPLFCEACRKALHEVVDGANRTDSAIPEMKK